MKVLWITNILFPEAQSLLSGSGSLKASGGWMLGAADALLLHPGIELYVATVSKQVKSLRKLEGERITYYLLPYGKGNLRENHDYETYWKEVNADLNPDIVHLHGTEFSHGLAYIKACGADNVCVSIQGLVSAYYYYYYYGLSIKEIRQSVTLLSLIRGGILKGYQNFKKRGEVEMEIIRKVHHIIGRTSWDKARTWAINPDAQYHYGGETLRSEFYDSTLWDYRKCDPHSIFLSQASYPIKGLHMVLRAMPLVLRHYPDTTIRIAGDDITCGNSFVNRLKMSDYGNVIRKLINKYNLADKITFIGALDGNGMCEEYLKSNVFVCPSTIENSPNSLGEAQILGVPVIASYVGGIPDMMKGDEDHLYRFEEVEMLANKIVVLFNSKEHVSTSKMRDVAILRHDPSVNASNLINIYRSICHTN